MMAEKQESLFSVFGIDKETYEKSKDILPTFDLGKLPVGSKVILKFMENTPKIVRLVGKFDKKEKDVRVMHVFVDTVFRATNDGSLLEVPVGFDYSMWLSSRSLSLGILKIADTMPDNKLAGVKVTIAIGLTEYKDYGENRVYSVSLAR